MSLSDAWLFLQQGVLSGLLTGSVYALLALAIVAVFKTTDVPNFAQGEMFMIAGYLALILLIVWKLPYAAVIPLTLVGVAFGGALFQRVVMERVTASRGVGVQLVIATLGLAHALKGVVRQTRLGDTPRSLPSLVSSDAVQVGDAFLTRLDVAIFIAAVVAMLLIYLMFAHTRVGKAMRAVSFNLDAAKLMGIDTDRIIALTFALGSALAAAGGILVSINIPGIDPLMGVMTGLKAFVAAIIGGLVSYPVTALGALAVGIIESFASFWSGALKDVIVFSLLIPVLMARSYMARHHEEEAEEIDQ